MFVIAGATGHVGSTVADQLLSKAQKVRVIVRDKAKGEKWAKRGAEVAVGTLDDPSFLTTTLKGAAGLFTLLPPPSFSVTDFYGAQRKMADVIAGAVKDSGVPHVVMLSSIGADLSSGNGPIRGLNYLETKLREVGTKLSAIRACYFQENVGSSVGPAKEQGIFPNFTPSADYPMPMIATKDIGVLAAQLLSAPASKSEIVDLEGPSYTIRQVAEKLGNALGKKLEIIDVPQSAWVDTMTKAGFPKPVAEVFAEMYGGFASGKIKPKGDRLVKGQTSIDETIRDLVR